MARTGPKSKYETPEALSEAIQAYFDECAVQEKKTTQAGLCVFLGFGSKQSFNDQEKRAAVKDSETSWKEVIAKARLLLEDAAWQRGKTIDIFYLKNYHGMSDRQDITSNGEGITFNLNFTGKK